ncbi:bifunctional NAD(P)H-hydrate repair enzyme [Clostridium polyendosporum]|uniref:Bifunctional NAD(P)H-hydrate repair enzyme n=1 Tax=Clostridium polyendosporum TaxID=69208 RepID=A0A919RYU5_9CLOT|nr:NAD(P)H-hydrate dehydratase [Clostridium polyendosporum]GIM28279.1 bifunctional NAD(P)H-hydrate repair enzyme [Clostridium polyendosporum]
MRVATSEIMRNIDKACIESLGIPGIVLMENAALKVLKHMDLENNHNFVVVCGSGNNGGDGFAIARHLKVKGKCVKVFLVSDGKKLSDDCATNYNILKNLGVKIHNLNNIEDCTSLKDALLNSDMTVDSLFGTGLSRKLDKFYIDIISIVNENSKYILSIDVPSGMDSNTGNVYCNCIEANKTVSFELYKIGFLKWNCYKYIGKVVVEDIGIPKFIIDKYHEGVFITTENVVRNNIPLRDVYAHKGDYGRALIIAGSKGFSGAAYISTQAAVRCGAGLVTLCTSEELQSILSVKLVEAMTSCYKDIEKLVNYIRKSNCIAIGPGLGDNQYTLSLVKEVLINSNCPIVIDADGINVLKSNLDLLKGRKAPVIITPHLGEMARITGYSIEYIRENRLEVAQQFAKDYGIVVLLKGYNTIITDGSKTYINPTGNSAMASGGMGDCLTGIITGLIAQGLAPFEGTVISAFIHGYIGEKLSENMYCVNASHVLDKIPEVIKDIIK